MGVSSLERKEVSYYKVRKYFERLMALNYDRVTIKWYDIHYISDLERQPDHGRPAMKLILAAHCILPVSSFAAALPPGTIHQLANP